MLALYFVSYYLEQVVIMWGRIGSYGIIIGSVGVGGFGSFGLGAASI